MQLGQAGISPLQWQQCVKAALCIYCRQAGHQLLPPCAKRPGWSGQGSVLVSQTVSSKVSSYPCTQLEAVLMWQQDFFPLHALIDSSVDENFWDKNFNWQGGIPTEALPSPKIVNAQDGYYYLFWYLKSLQALLPDQDCCTPYPSQAIPLTLLFVSLLTVHSSLKRKKSTSDLKELM